MILTPQAKESKDGKSYVGKFVGCCPYDLETLRPRVSMVVGREGEA
jgi:hypothetical protein